MMLLSHGNRGCRHSSRVRGSIPRRSQSSADNCAGETFTCQVFGDGSNRLALVVGMVKGTSRGRGAAHRRTPLRRRSRRSSVRGTWFRRQGHPTLWSDFHICFGLLSGGTAGWGKFGFWLLHRHFLLFLRRHKRGRRGGDSVVAQ